MKTIELKAEGRCLNAALYEPACAAEEKYPLVLFLHGAGERGDDIEKVLDFTPGVDAFTAPAWQAEHPCFVLAPQCPAGQSWVPYIGLLARMLYALPREYAIDECRIYVTGVSMGGAGTWALLTACPQKIAAAMPVCGYAAPFAVRAARHVPVWAFHAADDPVVPVTGEYHSPHGAVGVGTRMAVSSLRSAGNRDVHYTEYPAGCMEKDWGVHPHASWAAAYRDGRALAWLFEKSRRGRYEAELVCPGVFYIEDFNDDSMYLVEGREKALLIDTGLGSGDPLAFAKTLTAQPVELAVTHAHLDHMRHSYRFERFYMSKKDLPLLPRVQDSFPENTSAPEQVVDIREGDVIDLGGVEIEVFELGGHTPGSVVFIDRTHKCLFTGDALGLWMQVPMALPVSTYRENLLRLREKLAQPGYDELAFLGGHRRQEGGVHPGEPYVPNSYEKLEDMLALCEKLLAGEIKAEPYPIDFGEPAFAVSYKTASMVYKESVRR